MLSDGSPMVEILPVLKRDIFVETASCQPTLSRDKGCSFQRQLALYGFKRLTHGPDRGGIANYVDMPSKIISVLCHCHH
jgi:hypothetical protein